MTGLVIKIDHLLHNSPKLQSLPHLANYNLNSSPHMPDTLNPCRSHSYTCISTEERHRWWNEGLCFYSGEPGHQNAPYPHKNKSLKGSRLKVNTTNFEFPLHHSFSLPVEIASDKNYKGYRGSGLRASKKIEFTKIWSKDSTFAQSLEYRPSASLLWTT